ncbi:MAG: amino acid permease [Rhodospirillaceae bacterium]|nr:MAG: amino acid permease [Rhodospirillaceae bacterium]
MSTQDHSHDEDVKVLHSMGYAQELSRRMGLFQNFAISFSIICILAGGITAFPLSLSAAGGASLGIGWPLSTIFGLLVACALGQVASAYPTAGGIYHWASILGNKGWGWLAAWLNLFGLLFVVSSVNFGVFLLFRDLFLAGVLHMDVTSWTTQQAFDSGWWTQTLFIAGITVAQAIINHVGIRATTMLTDFSGYLIFVVAVILTVALIAYAPTLDFSRLFTFHDYTGDAGGGVWVPPAGERWLGTLMPAVGAALVLGLLQGVYTITGFDASGHTSEETRNAAREVPKGMIHSVFWSGVFGYVMVCAFVLALPSVDDGAKQGWNAFPWLMQQSPMPGLLRNALIIFIVLSNFLCALAGMTSCSRMLYAFSRDGGVPWFSKSLRQVSKKYRTPAHAIWASAVLSVVATLYGDAFVVLSTGCAVFLYVSYLMPIAAGLFAEGGKWSKKGPFNLGGLSKPVALLAIVGCIILIIVGVQPPNEKVGYLLLWGVIALVAIYWLVERRRFQGPPLTPEQVAARQAEIAREEAALAQS